jgi:histidinol-phosphate aminotransferase
VNPNRLLRPLVRRLHAYVPGEQPAIRGLIKLNTNENPYPPAPAVLRAIRQATDARLRLYPNPTSQQLRDALARRHRCEPENVIVGNGSDELLALAVRTFVEPAADAGRVRNTSAARRNAHRKPSRSTVQFCVPSYSLYPVLAQSHGARSLPVPLRPDFGLPDPASLRRAGRWDASAALTFVTTPNAPSGRGYTRTELETFCRAHRCVVLLDEAYVDFAAEDALELALHLPNVLVTRTFSKAYALCFARVGYAIGHPALIAGLDKMRDSYNVNGLGQVAALETLAHPDYYAANFHRICRTRARVSAALEALGFAVLPSQANFILARPPRWPAAHWHARLRRNRVLVRWFDTPQLRSYLRITIGTETEMETLLNVIRVIS